MLGQLSLVLGIALAQTIDVTNTQSSATAYFPPNLFLVRTLTVDVKKAKEKNDVGTFLIKHVYAGNASLKGKSFECSTSFIPMFSGIVQVNKDRRVEFLENNVEGLWWVYVDKENKLRPELRAEIVDSFRIRRFPFTNGQLGTLMTGSRVDRTAEWKQGLAWAEAVETVYLARSDIEREAILKRLAAVEQSAASPWAIHLLGKVNPRGTTEFLRKLAGNDKLSGESHVVLDTVLSRFDPKWNSADHWERLLSRWLESPDLDYFNDAMKHLSEMARKNEIGFGSYSKLLDKVLAKADQLKDGQEIWLGIVLRTPPTFPFSGDKAFGWQAGHVRDGKTTFVREHAAAGLRVFGRLNSSQLELVKALRAESNETQIQQALDVVLKSH